MSTHLTDRKQTDRLTDQALISRAQKGDRGAFSHLVNRYQNTVYRFSYKVCRDRDKAEEAVQDTFINVFRKLQDFDGRSKFSTWLYSIVTNNCLMKRRRRRLDDASESLDEPSAVGTTSLSEQLVDHRETPAEFVIRKELNEVLDRAILKLPLDYRIVFVLRDLEGKSTEETASILHLGVEATKSRLRRARAFLQKELSPYLRESRRR